MSVWHYVLNTTIVGFFGVLGSLFIASLSSFTFAQMSFPGKKILYYAVIMLMMVPGVLTLVPSYMLYRNLGLLNSYLILILPLIVGGPIFGVFLLTTFFESLPKDFFEAAQIDGATDFKCYYKVALPLCMPILGTLTIMQLIGVWNDYLWPMITIHDTDKLTISAGLLINFTRQYSSNMPVTFAGYLVASIPLILLFVFANKYYIEGLISSSIKM
jgi:multiple sugar transport system permease protein